MSHFIGSLTIELHIPTAQSLKDKRSVLKSIITKTRSRFNVSIIETGCHDLWQRSELAVAVVVCTQAEIDPFFESILGFVQSCLNGDIVSVHKEIL